jgi:hypothetical protein
MPVPFSLTLLGGRNASGGGAARVALAFLCDLSARAIEEGKVGNPLCIEPGLTEPKDPGVPARAVNLALASATGSRVAI